MKTAYAADCAYRTTVLIQDIIIPIYFFEAVYFTQPREIKLFDGKCDKKVKMVHLQTNVDNIYRLHAVG